MDGTGVLYSSQLGKYSGNFPAFYRNRVQSNTFSFTYANIFKKNLLSFAHNGVICAKICRFLVLRIL